MNKQEPTISSVKLEWARHKSVVKRSRYCQEWPQWVESPRVAMCTCVNFPAKGLCQWAYISYFYFSIMWANLVSTAYLYFPVLRQVKIFISLKISQIRNKQIWEFRIENRYNANIMETWYKNLMSWETK